MDNRFESLQKYIQAVIRRAGTDYAVGCHLGYGDGSRVGVWKRGGGRPDELACVKLARWMGDNPLEVLRLAGYQEMAEALEGTVMPTPPPEVSGLRPMLAALQEQLGAVLRTIDKQAKGGS